MKNSIEGFGEKVFSMPVMESRLSASTCGSMAACAPACKTKEAGKGGSREPEKGILSFCLPRFSHSPLQSNT